MPRDHHELDIDYTPGYPSRKGSGKGIERLPHDVQGDAEIALADLRSDQLHYVLGYLSQRVPRAFLEAVDNIPDSLR